MEIIHLDLGRALYRPVWELQKQLVDQRKRGAIPDVLITVEHEPVLTLGRRGSLDNLLVSPEELARLGIELVRIERGGDITYHGPGQLVMYPILDLRGYGHDLHRYIASLEQVMIETAQRFGVRLERRPGFPGAWQGQRKVGSIGVHVRGWITMHGLAFNVDLDPDHFRLIVPCGLEGVEAVSLAALAGRKITLEEAKGAALAAFSQVFSATLIPGELERLKEGAGETKLA